MVLAYALLLAAIAVEVLGTSLLPHTAGFSRPVPTVVCLGAYVASFALLALAIRDLPVSTAYAVWSGLGTLAIATIGITLLGEPISLGKVLGLLLVITGVVVLSLGGAH